MKTRIVLLISMFFVLTQSVIAQKAAADSLSTVSADRTLPVASPYYLQHQYLSVLAPMIAESDGWILGTPYALNTVSTAGNGFRSPFDDSDIQVEKITVEGKDIFVWRFPEPEYLREALYMAFVPIDGYYQAFAICIGELVDWEISTSTQTARSTFGRVKKPENARECVDLLIERGALTGSISMGEFIQDGYTSPEYRP